ncbi:MAG: hypothetical protein KDK55_05505 [Chlamydiia bacterium]|nr:hypothetical protein [Chlamydiia bacterium]
MCYNGSFTASFPTSHYGTTGNHGAPGGTTGGSFSSIPTVHTGGSHWSSGHTSPPYVYTDYHLNTSNSGSSPLTHFSYSNCLTTVCSIACFTMIAIGIIMALAASPATGTVMVKEVCYSGVILTVISTVAVFFLLACYSVKCCNELS